MRRPLAVFALALAALTANLSATGAAPPDEPIQPVPLAQPQDPARAALGRRLFQDTRLSANNSMSCASCHDLAKGGADGRGHSSSFSGARMRVNTPTVFNAALNFRQFWDGRADSLEAQVDAVIRNSQEMGASWPAVLAMVARDPGYKAGFGAAYADGVTQANVQNAIATYERTLTTPGSRFDAWLRGDHKAITGQELAGYEKFKRYGCVACHQGVNVGGNMYQKFGVMHDYFARRGQLSDADLGRMAVTRDPADRYVFKVPSLRNVALTAPYFHDGSALTLEQAVEVMFKYQLGRTASKQDKADIVAFLRTLTGRPQEPRE